jgi:hypothetical protein
VLSKKIKIIFLVLLFSSVISINSCFGAISFFSPPSINRVTIDGKWTTTNEWEEAKEFPIKFGFTHYIFGYFLIKDNEEFLYVLIDHTPDVTLEDGDSGKIKLDIDNDGFDSPKKDDYIISIEWNGNKTDISVQQGNGTEWVMVESMPEGIEAASTNNAENNPYSENQHLIYEFAIPRKITGNEPVIGFSASAIDWSVERANVLERSETIRPRYILFPSGAHYKKPSTWAKLQFSTPFEEESKSESSLNPKQDSALPNSPPSNPKSNPETTPKPIPNPEPSPTVNPKESKNEPASSNLSGGYMILASIMIIVIIFIYIILSRRRKN